MFEGMFAFLLCLSIKVELVFLQFSAKMCYLNSVDPFGRLMTQFSITEDKMLEYVQPFRFPKDRSYKVSSNIEKVCGDVKGICYTCRTTLIQDLLDSHILMRTKKNHFQDLILGIPSCCVHCYVHLHVYVIKNERLINQGKSSIITYRIVVAKPSFILDSNKL